MYYDRGLNMAYAERAAQLEKIFVRYGILKRYSAGQILVERGQPASLSCYIQKGYARTFCINPAGDDITLFYIEPHNMICSESLLLDSLVNVSVQAISAVEMYVLPGEQLLQRWTDQGYGIHELFSPLITRLTLLSDYICCAHFRENNKKVAYFLYSCYTRTGPVAPYTNEQIADVTGINWVSVNRILNTFEKEGIVELSYKRVTVLDIERLMQIFGAVGYFID